MSDIINDTKTKMKKSIDSLSRELANISAGRANSNLLNGVTVDYYGAPTPIQQLASINVPEARLLVISPYDKTSVANIEKAINAANLGVNPSSDGEVIRISVPALTEERRKELVKEVKKLVKILKLQLETYAVIRMTNLKSKRKRWHHWRWLKNSNEWSTKITDDSINDIDKLLEEKEQDIMSV